MTGDSGLRALSVLGVVVQDGHLVNPQFSRWGIPKGADSKPKLGIDRVSTVLRTLVPQTWAAPGHDPLLRPMEKGRPCLSGPTLGNELQHATARGSVGNGCT